MEIGVPLPKQWFFEQSPLAAKKRWVEIYGDSSPCCFVWGNMDPIPFITTCRSEELKIQEEIAQTCGAWIPGEDVVVVSDRPKTVNLRNFIPHCTKGPTFEWRDGFKLWHYKRVEVDEKTIIDPQNLQYSEIFSGDSLELRAAKLERYGLKRFIEEQDLQIVAQDEDITYYWNHWIGIAKVKEDFVFLDGRKTASLGDVKNLMYHHFNHGDFDIDYGDLLFKEIASQPEKNEFKYSTDCKVVVDEHVTSTYVLSGKMDVYSETLCGERFCLHCKYPLTIRTTGKDPVQIKEGFWEVGVRRNIWNDFAIERKS